MKETNFILYEKSKSFSFTLFEYSINIPKKYLFIKSKLLDYDNFLIESIRYYMLNKNSSFNLKNKYLKDIVLSISMIDYYLSLLNDYKVLGKNKFNTLSTSLLEIRKIAYGVINSEKK